MYILLLQKILNEIRRRLFDIDKISPEAMGLFDASHEVFQKHMLSNNLRLPPCSITISYPFGHIRLFPGDEVKKMLDDM